jgi:integrase
MKKTRRTVMAKRGNGEGSISQRKSDGLWMGRITLRDGSRKAFYGKTRQEVARKLAEAIRDREKGLPQRTDERMTVGAFMTQWLQSKNPSVGDSTQVRYEANIRDITKYLGRYPLARLTPTMLEKFYADLQAPEPRGRELSSTTVNRLHVMFKEALDTAVRHNLIARNPADLATAPRVRDTEMRPLTFDESKVFLGAIQGHSLEALFFIAVTTGMRQGELLALHWKEVDLDHGRVSVTTALHYRAGKGFWLGKPKTQRSRRMVPIMPEAVTLLRQWKAQQARMRLEAGPSWRTDWPDLVFTNSVGGPRYPADVVSRSFKPILHRAGLPTIRFHDLRHTAATLMLLKGVQAKVVSERLGHASIQITLDRYSHVLPGMQEDATEILRRALLFS